LLNNVRPVIAWDIFKSNAVSRGIVGKWFRLAALRIAPQTEAGRVAANANVEQFCEAWGIRSEIAKNAVIIALLRQVMEPMGFDRETERQLGRKFAEKFNPMWNVIYNRPRGRTGRLPPVAAEAQARRLGFQKRNIRDAEYWVDAWFVCRALSLHNRADAMTEAEFAKDRKLTLQNLSVKLQPIDIALGWDRNAPGRPKGRHTPHSAPHHMGEKERPIPQSSHEHAAKRANS